jgi:hypothetical protein
LKILSRLKVRNPSGPETNAIDAESLYKVMVEALAKPKIIYSAMLATKPK